MRRHLRPLAAVAAGLGILASMLPAVAVQAGSPDGLDYTWGYNFQRTRQTASIDAQMSLVENGICSDVSPDAPCVERFPYVVPLPGSSTGTLVATQDDAYFVTHAGDTAWLWDIPLTSKGPGRATLLNSFSLQPGESFDAPSDPSVSPDLQWLAVGLGNKLYWRHLMGGPWTWGKLGPGNPSTTSMVSMAPVFVPDNPGGPSHYVCEGDWNGAFDCFDLNTGRQVVQYKTDDAYPQDTAAQITSSPALLPDGRVCFGISSFVAPRVACVQPSQGPDALAQDGIGLGTILNPVAASTLYNASNGNLYVTDQAGNVYRLDPDSGQAVATQYGTAGPGLTIVSPALDPSGGLWVGATGDNQLCRLDAGSLAIRYCLAEGGATAPTVAVDGSYVTAWDFLAEGVINVLNTASGQQTAYAIAPPGAVGPGAETFTAAVVGIGPGHAVAVWSDTGTTAWASGQYGFGQPDPYVLPPPAGFSLSQTPGGLQVWHTSPKLLAWAAPDPVYAGDGQRQPQQYYVFALTPVPGTDNSDAVSGDTSAVAAAVAVTLPDGKTAQMQLIDAGEMRSLGDPLPKALLGNGGVGVFAPTWAALQGYYDAANDPREGWHARTLDGTPPRDFTGWMLWRAGPFVAPAAPAYYTLAVGSITRTGMVSAAYPVLEDFCPVTDTPTRTGCEIPPPPPSGNGGDSGSGGSGGNGASSGSGGYKLHVHGINVCGEHLEYCLIPPPPEAK